LVVVEARDVELRHARKADRARAHLDLGPRGAVGPYRVLGGEGRVEECLLPAGIRILVHRGGTLDVRDAAHSGGRILGRGAEGERGAGRGKGEGGRSHGRFHYSGEPVIWLEMSP